MHQQQTQPDKILANGYRELQRRSLPDGSYIILAVQHPIIAGAPEYATWREFDGVTKWGHYFNSAHNPYAEIEARRDFETRTT